jgi:hypothetical protein
MKSDSIGTDTLPLAVAQCSWLVQLGSGFAALQTLAMDCQCFKLLVVLLEVCSMLR